MTDADDEWDVNDHIDELADGRHEGEEETELGADLEDLLD